MNDNNNGTFFPIPQTPDVTGLILEKYLPQAVRAHNNVSFSPERRGATYIHDYSKMLTEDLAKIAEKGGDAAAYQEKFERLFLAWMAAKANCISSMITGPARFPTRRAEKANTSEDNRRKELHEWRDRVFAALDRNLRKANSISPIEEARKHVAQEQMLLDYMKAANKIVLDKKKTNDEKMAEMLASGMKEGVAQKLLIPDYGGRLGFPAFSLTNCRARLKANEARLAELERRATTEAKETEREDGIRVVDNAADNRLQVFFPGKPDDATRAKLKSSGFRWSPTNGCWQSYLNSTAKEKLKAILG